MFRIVSLMFLMCLAVAPVFAEEKTAGDFAVNLGVISWAQIQRGMTERPTSHTAEYHYKMAKEMAGMHEEEHQPDEEHGVMHEHWTAPPEVAKRKNPVPANAASSERGRKLFEKHCVSCHGPSGRGDGPAGAGLTPRPPDLAEIAGQHPPGDLAWKIENGRGPMPAWKGLLTETQIWDLVNFILNLERAGKKRSSERHHHNTRGHNN